MRSFRRGIKKAREWCRANSQPVSLSEFFGPGAEVFTTPGSGTFYLIYKYDNCKLSVILSGKNLYVKGWHGDRFGGFKIDEQFIKDPEYIFLNTGDNYTALCKCRSVSTVRIGFQAIIDNFEVLHKCNGIISTDLCRAIAVFAVNGPEAIRFEDVLDAIMASKQFLLGKDLAAIVNNYYFYSNQLLACLDSMLQGKGSNFVNKYGINFESVHELW